MRSFIDLAVQKILKKKMPLDKIAVVVPSQRAIRYLQKALGEQLETPSFAPTFFHIGSFVESLSGLKRTSTPLLIVQLYEAYCALVQPQERQSFERFLSWGPSVLKMFNDLDAHLVPVESFFKDLKEYYRLQSWGEDLSNKSFIGKQITLYHQLPSLYQAYQLRLSEQGLAYMGLQYRQGVDALESYMSSNDQYHLFLGFNALNQAEQTLIREFMSQERGEVLWNLDAYFFKQKQHKAGRYIRQYHREWPELRRNEAVDFPKDFEQPKTIETLGVQGTIGQVIAAVSIIEKEQLDPSKTVLVLGDEAYLSSLLSFLNPTLEWNVTMGYPIAEQAFILLSLEWLSFIQTETDDFLSLKELVPLVNVPILKAIYGKKWDPVSAFLQGQLKQNKGRVSRQEWLDKTAHIDEFQSLFEKLYSPLDALKKLSAFTAAVLNSKSKRISALEHSVTERLHQVLCLVEEQILHENRLENLQSLQLFLQILIQPETLDLIGSTEKGLQIMGVLETRLLDFENVIVTHLNEGTLPKGVEPTHPLVPFALQKAYDLPTFLDQDAVYTDHFYRMIQRSRRVFLLYNEQAEGLNPGEKSRFLYQLQLQGLQQHTYKERQVQFSRTQNPWELSEVSKDSEILQKLEMWSEQGISATALGTYLRDPLMFYRKFVLGVEEDPPAMGRMSPKDRGNVLHQTLEELYKPWILKQLTAKALDQMLERLPIVLEEQYQKVFGGDSQRTGYPYMDYELLNRQLMNYIEGEKKSLQSGKEVHLQSLERKVDWVWESNPLKRPIRFKGYIDRLEIRDGQLTIVDYKSGRVEPSALKIDHWEQLIEEPKKDKALQLCFYAWLLAKAEGVPNVYAGNIGFKNSPIRFQPVQWQPKRGDISPTLLDQSHLQTIEQMLGKLITEILDPHTPFKAR